MPFIVDLALTLTLTFYPYHNPYPYLLPLPEPAPPPKNKTPNPLPLNAPSSVGIEALGSRVESYVGSLTTLGRITKETVQHL